MSRADVIVIGGGHNGLTTATALAKRGRKVVVLERRDQLGGIAASEEFHPGYKSAGLLHDTTGVHPQVVEALQLEKHGLQLRQHRMDVLALNSGNPLLIPGDPTRAAASLSKHSEMDGPRYREFRAQVDEFGAVLRTFAEETPLDLVDIESLGIWGLVKRALRVRMLGKRKMTEMLRLPPMCVADWLNEWFENDLLKTALAVPAVAGTFTGPWSPGSATNLLLWEAIAGPGVQKGGPALVAALESAAKAAGVELRCGAAVERIVVGSDGVSGVLLQGGEKIEGSTIASSCDPKRTFLEFLPPGAITYRLEHRIDSYRARGTTAHVLLALSKPPSFTGSEGVTELSRTGSELDDIERAFDAVKYRKFSDKPILEVHVPTVSDPSLCPDGHAVASVLVHFVPHDLEGGWTDARRDELGDVVVKLLDAQAPGVAQDVVGRLVRSPADLEETYGLTGGHIHHGEHSLDQLLVRPAPDCVQYSTPLSGLYLCGSGSHPGGGITCRPGALAAEAILRA